MIGPKVSLSPKKKDMKLKIYQWIMLLQYPTKGLLSKRRLECKLGMLITTLIHILNVCSKRFLKPLLMYLRVIFKILKVYKGFF